MNRMSRVVFLALGAIALFYLITEHQAHLFGVLPYLLLLACPLMHLFMHHGHGGHHGRDDGGSGGQRPGTSATDGNPQAHQ
jgi:hypothetical protein